ALIRRSFLHVATQALCGSAKDRFGGGRQVGDAALLISHNHRVAKQVERGGSRLLRHYKLAYVAASQLANALGHAVEFGSQQTDFVACADFRASIELASGNAGGGPR